MRRTTLKVAIITVAVAAFLAPALADAQGARVGRVQLTVVDENGAPIPGVKVSVTSKAYPNFLEEGVTNKKGKITIAHPDATVIYDYQLEKEGYRGVIQPIKPTPGDVQLTQVDMPSLGAAPVAAEADTPLGGSPAVQTYNAGVLAQREGDLATAEAKYREAIKFDSSLAEPWAALASIHIERGEFTEAAAAAQEAITREPNNVRALSLRYDACRQAGDEEAAEAARRALEAAGGTADAAKRIFNEGAAAFNAGRLDEAQARFQEAVALDRTLLPAQMALASVYVRQNRFDAAGEVATAILEQDPNHSQALKIRYDAARIAGDEAAAAAALEKLTSVDPEWVRSGLFEHAVNLFNENKHADAVIALEQVLEAEPDHPRAHYILGLALYNQGQVPEATVHLKRFLELAPDDPDAAIADEMLKYAQQ